MIKGILQAYRPGYTGAKLSRRDIRSDLARRGVSPEFVFGVHALKSLRSPQYGAFLDMLSLLKLSSTGPLYKLKLPSVKDLARIDFEKVFESEVAMSHIGLRCKNFERSELDLTLLPRIYDSYVLSSRPPESLVEP